MGPSQLFDPPTITRLIIDLLGNYGDVMAYEPGSMCPPTIVYRAEYYDTRAADRAIAHLNGFKIAVCSYHSLISCILTWEGLHPRCV